MRVFLICLWVLTLSIATEVTSVAKKTPIPGPTPRIPLRYASGPCDTADVLAMLGTGDAGLLHKRGEEAVELIRARIATCDKLISGYISALPAAPPEIASLISAKKYPRPTPMPQEPDVCKKPSGDALHFYEDLATCVAMFKALPSLVPAPSPLSAKFGGSNENKIIYAIGLADSIPISSQLSVRLADELNVRKKNLGKDRFTGGAAVNYHIVALPSLTLDQYQQRCFTDGNTAGAVVVLQPGTQSGTWNILLASVSWTAVQLQALVLDCEPGNTAFQNNVGFITWSSGIHEQVGRRGGVPLATVLGALASIAAFHPSHTTSTQTTRTTVTPTPPAFLPPGTQPVASVQSTDSTTSNPDTVGAIAAAGVLALTPSGSTIIGAGPGDAQFASGARKAIVDLVRDVVGACNSDPDLTQCDWGLTL